MLNLPFDNSKPDIFLTPKEDKMGEDFVRGQGGPVVLVQATGGVVPNEHGQKPAMFIRDLDLNVVKNVIDEIKDEFKVVQLKTPTQPGWEDVYAPELNLRDCFIIISKAQKLLAIDSFAQHAAAAFGVKSVVCWGATNPKLLGYDIHTNLTREKACPTPFCDRPNSYLFDQVVDGQQWECPHGEVCTRHDEGAIIKSLKSS